VQDLLAYNRLTRIELVPARLELGKLVEAAMAEMRDELAQAGAEVRAELPPGLPPVLAHRAASVQIVANLLSNAAKFVPPGRRPVVQITATARPGFVRLCVRDNGIGVAPEHHERIFRVFERLHGGESFPGTGIGLAIVRRGALRMGGKAGVESAPGGGSTFWVDFPAAG
jgi:signal transduction histidine kinase